MCRLKTLLPQSEVQDTKQPSELKPTTTTMTTNHVNQSRKRIRETEEHCKIEDCDSDSCDSSDDTIDEFVSSEDVSQSKKPKSFAKSTTDTTALLVAKHLGLPSMLSICYSSVIGRPNTRTAENGELKCVGETSSARSSGSVTVGSLQQMSLELSEEELSLEDKTASCVANTRSGTKKQSNVEIKSDKSDKNGTDNIRTALLQPSLDLSLEDCFASQPMGPGKREGDGLMRPDEKGNAQLPNNGEEWHLTFDGSSEENSNNSLGDKNITDFKIQVQTAENTKAIDDHKNDFTAIDEQLNKQLMPEVDDTMVTPPTKRRKTSKERKKTSRDRKRRSHHRRDHRNRRDHRDQSDHKDNRDRRTDLLTPVEGDAMVSATPRKLFHTENSDKKKKSPKQRKRSTCRKSEAEKDQKSIKEADVVIDLTLEDKITQTKAVVTGSTKIDDVIEDAQKGKPPTQGPPRQCPNVKNTDHQLTKTHTLISNLEPNLEDAEADSDITFCEEGSEHYSILGSPSYLPPTPGRENVTSILKRKSIAFSE